MNLVEYIKQYLEGKVSAIKTIRTLSGAFNPDHSVTLLTLICAITRIEEGDLDKDTFWRVYLKQDTDEFEEKDET